MKKQVGVLLVAIVSMAIWGAIGCEKKVNLVNTTWHIIDAKDEDGQEIPSEDLYSVCGDIYITFLENDKFKYEDKEYDYEQEASYVLMGNVVTLYFADGVTEDLTFTIYKDKMAAKQGDHIYCFAKEEN